MQALHAAAAAHHGQVSAAIAVLALASGDSTVDEAGNLLVTAKRDVSQLHHCFIIKMPNVFVLWRLYLVIYSL